MDFRLIRKNLLFVLVAFMLFATGCNKMDGDYIIFEAKPHPSSLRPFATKLKGRRFRVESQNGFIILRDLTKNRDIVMKEKKDDSNDYYHDSTGTIYIATETRNGITFKYRLNPNSDECDLLLLIYISTERDLSRSEFEYMDIINTDRGQRNEMHFAQIGGIKSVLLLTCYLGKLD